MTNLNHYHLSPPPLSISVFFNPLQVKKNFNKEIFFVIFFVTIPFSVSANAGLSIGIFLIPIFWLTSIPSAIFSLIITKDKWWFVGIHIANIANFLSIAVIERLPEQMWRYTNGVTVMGVVFDSDYFIIYPPVSLFSILMLAILVRIFKRIWKDLG